MNFLDYCFESNEIQFGIFFFANDIFPVIPYSCFLFNNNLSFTNRSIPDFIEAEWLNRKRKFNI